MTELWPQLVPERIELANEPEFKLGALRILPSERAVIIGEVRRELQPRVMQVLVALAKARPSVVSRDKLIELCWDGRVVGDDALNRCILALRHLAQEFDPPPYAIETVPRIGHRLIDNAADPPRRVISTPAKGRWRLAAVLLALLLMTAATYFAWRNQPAGGEPASIAVLPFRNMSDGDPYFAEGLGEEVLSQLAREPAFRVAGRGSSAQFEKDTDPREIGRKLDVDYVLEGSVRSDAGRVRVSAALVKTSDGMQLWSETYDRRLADVLQIQAAIGEAVAAELSRRLVHPFAQARRSRNGEAYILYLNARGMLRTGSPEVGSEAVSLLQQSVKQDPTYAPAWASYADALYLDGRSKGAEGLIASLPKARAAAARAIRLDPELAYAHSIGGQLLGYETPQGVNHLRRASQLAPNTGEGLLWKARAHGASDEFSAALEATKRAHEVDPAWQGPLRALIDSMAEMGDRAGAEELARASFQNDEWARDFALARIAWFVGDFSDAAKLYARVASSPARWSRPSNTSLEDLKYMLGLSGKIPPTSPVASIGSFSRYVPRLWITEAPSPAEWLQQNRSNEAALVYHDRNILAAKHMLNAGRAEELVASYDSPTGLLGLRRGASVGYCQFQEVPLVALALRKLGRYKEAEELLRQATVRLGAAYRHGEVPNWFDGDAAALWAVKGDTAKAIAAFNRAIDRGWLFGGRIDLVKIDDEPAFRSLLRDPGFQTVLAKYRRRIENERKEASRLT